MKDQIRRSSVQPGANRPYMRNVTESPAEQKGLAPPVRSNTVESRISNSSEFPCFLTCVRGEPRKSFVSHFRISHLAGQLTNRQANLTCTSDKRTAQAYCSNETKV